MFLNTVPEKNYNSALRTEYLDHCIGQMARGNRQGLSDLYQQTAASVYSYAFSILKNSCDAEDAMHDTYLQLYRAAGSYCSAGKPMAWILTVTRNLCLHTIRNRSKISDISREEWNRAEDEEQGAAVEDRLLIRKCMQILDDEQRQIVVLHAVAGLKHREIAAQLGLLLPTVISKYNRAIKKLRQAMEREGAQT